MRIPVLLLSALVVTSPVLAQNDPGSAEALGARFCEDRGDIWYDGRQHYLSPDLLAAIEAAVAVNESIAAAHPDEKPPLGDGIPWQTWPDYADSCTPGEPLYMMDEAQLHIAYGFADATDAGFTDRLDLVLIDGAWKLDNVVYDNDAGNLRATLAEVAAGKIE